MHLPAAPSTAPGPLLGVVAHELTHARRPVSRPRFLLEGLHGGGDDDERSALALGRRFAGSLGGAVTGGADEIRAGIVDDLPVGGLGRVTGSTGLSKIYTYSYDLDADRLTRVDGSVSTTFTYDWTDELTTQTISGTQKSYAYDRYGNLTTAWDAASTSVTYGYDEASRLVDLVARLVVALDKPRDDERLRLRARLCETALDEEDVEPLLHGRSR